MEKLNLLLTNGPRITYCNFKRKEVKKQKDKTSPIECEYTIEITIDDDKNEVSVSLSVKSESENIPFEFDVKAEAKFKCEKKCSSEQQAIEESIPYIYSFLKELVADLTRKSYLSPFYLPPIELDLKKFNRTE